jgi:hypothetical protein
MINQPMSFFSYPSLNFSSSVVNLPSPSFATFEVKLSLSQTSFIKHDLTLPPCPKTVRSPCHCLTIFDYQSIYRHILPCHCLIIFGYQSIDTSFSFSRTLFYLQRLVQYHPLVIINWKPFVICLSLVTFCFLLIALFHSTV